MITAATIGAKQLQHSEGFLRGPASADVGGVLAGVLRPVVVVLDDGSAVASLVLSRLRFLGSVVKGMEAA